MFGKTRAQHYDLIIFQTHFMLIQNVYMNDYKYKYGSIWVQGNYLHYASLMLVFEET